MIMSAPGIYYHVGKYLVWIWHNHTQKKQIKYEDIIFQYPIKLFWIVGIIAGILFIIIGYILFRLIKDL
jgi:hypothetical protein